MIRLLKILKYSISLMILFIKFLKMFLEREVICDGL